MTESRFMFRRIARVAASRFIALGADESGVALAVTILMFSLLFLSFASVYAIGTVTREKIHLQNAADAAAYSAAVVQADTLSRLATINRAMAWTYVQQTRREMDYIVYKWLQLTVQRFNSDYGTARQWNQYGNCPYHTTGSPGVFWNIGNHCLYPTIDLNGHWNVKQLVDASLPLFNVHLLSQSKSADIPLIGEVALGLQITADSLAIAAMNLAEQSLAWKMKGRMKRAAEMTLDANIPSGWKRDVFYAYHHDDGLLGSLTGLPTYLRMAKNDAADERQFCGGVYADGLYPDGLFDTGIDDWFVLARGKGERAGGSEIGLRRAYVQSDPALRSAWSWYSFFCIYIPPTPFNPEIHIPIPDLVDHPDWEVSTTALVVHNSQTLGGDPEHSHYETAKAMPWFLKLDYFSSDGTVSVGVARRTSNVWQQLVGSAGGLLAAFNPSMKWSWAFSSAKAGYHRPFDSNANSRAYDISWRGDSQGHGFETSNGERRYWNLCETDWDAVFLPVRKAKTMANYSAWTIGSTTFMQKWAAGNWTPMGGGSVSSGDMASVPAPSGVGSGNSSLDWGRLTDVMYH